MTNTAAINYTGRYIGTCKVCKVTRSGRTLPKMCCGLYLRRKEVLGSAAPSIPCDARCLNAKRTSCDCSCGGGNHGKGWEAIGNLPDALQSAPRIAVALTDFGVIAHADPIGTVKVYGIAV